jgi:hypothetical protein
MNGPTNPLYVFDTNAIIAALNGKSIVLQAKLVTADKKIRALVWPGFSALPPLL